MPVRKKEFVLINTCQYLEKRVLAINYWLLAISYWLLPINYWLLATSYWLLASSSYIVLYKHVSLPLFLSLSLEPSFPLSPSVGLCLSLLHTCLCLSRYLSFSPSFFPYMWYYYTYVYIDRDVEGEREIKRERDMWLSTKTQTLTMEGNISDTQVGPCNITSQIPNRRLDKTQTLLGTPNRGDLWAVPARIMPS